MKVDLAYALMTINILKQLFFMAVALACFTFFRLKESLLYFHNCWRIYKVCFVPGSLESLLAIACIIWENHHVDSCKQNQVLQSLPLLIPFLQEGTLGEIYKSSTSQRSYFWSRGCKGGRARGSG